MNTPQKWLIFMSAAVFLSTIFFGLRPKDFDYSNNVRWIPDKSGIHFDINSIAFTELDKPQDGKNWPGTSAFSVEIAIEANRIDSTRIKVILSLHGGEDKDQLIIGQWRSYLIAMNGNDYGKKDNPRRVEAEMAPSALEPIFISLTSGQNGTHLYINGHPVNSLDIQLELPKGNHMLFTLGNSVYGLRPWQGNVLGVAFYDHELSFESILTHYNHWTSTKKFDPANDATPILNYLFDENKGEVAANNAGKNHALKFPAWKPLLKKIFFSIQLSDFELNKVFFLDVIINLIGFIPLGFCLAAVLLAFGVTTHKHAILLSMGMCLIISLGIETTQAWIPTRTSQFMDVLMNTLGGLAGAVCVKNNYPHSKNPSIHCPRQKPRLENPP